MSEITGKDLGLTAVKGKLLRIDEVAVFLRVSERYVQKHIADGTFPMQTYPIGRIRVVDSVDLDNWLKNIVTEAGTAILPLKAIIKLQKKEVCA